MAVIAERREPVNALAWIMVITMFPVGGMVLFLLLGKNYRKLRTFMQKELFDSELINSMCGEQLRDIAHPDNEAMPNKKFVRLMLNNSKSLLTLHNRVEILNNGELDSEGYVMFHVGEFHEGNVGLAAYDVDGEILWSWHIWFTDKPVDLITGNYTFMDRNIGATTTPNTAVSKLSFANTNERMATYGFYYQWGRKDPIMGPPAYNSGDETVVLIKTNIKATSNKIPSRIPSTKSAFIIFLPVFLNCSALFLTFLVERFNVQMFPQS